MNRSRDHENFVLLDKVSLDAFMGNIASQAAQIEGKETEVELVLGCQQHPSDGSVVEYREGIVWIRCRSCNALSAKVEVANETTERGVC